MADSDDPSLVASKDLLSSLTHDLARGLRALNQARDFFAEARVALHELQRRETLNG